MNKKGQAAMEFLMTYGWAILAAIIAIGVLAYFGVFNPSSLASPTAAMNAPLNIPQGGFNIVNDDATNCGGFDCFNIQVTQNVGSSITISGAVVTLTSGGTATCTDAAWTNPWTSGSSQTFNFNCGAADIFGAGDSVAGSIKVTYTIGNGPTQIGTGSVRGVVQ